MKNRAMNAAPIFTPHQRSPRELERIERRAATRRLWIVHSVFQIPHTMIATRSQITHGSVNPPVGER